ncbi:MAG: radical SAM protein [Aquificae bacterium]|nr:radical SAM protein [Aquificota bacterium]
MRLLRVIEGDLNKLLIFELKDRFAVEAVHYRGDTLCISTQVGCGVRCSFCASGREGLIRNLSEEEILSQYLLAKELFPIKRIAVAGIGEPLANFKNVLSAFLKLKREGLKVSFYTTGFPVSNLLTLLDMPHNGVTISIHSLSERKRKLLLPYAGSLKHLISALRKKLPSLTKKKRRKISLAYLLLKKVNDSPEELTRLGKLAKELDVGITLLYYNQVGDYEPPSPEEYENAFLLLRSMGVRVTLSTRFRKDKVGGCGTLTVDIIADTKGKEVKT